MKVLSVVAFIVVMSLSASATTTKHKSTTHKATSSSSSAHHTTTAKHTTAASSHSGTKSHASLETAKYSPTTTSASRHSSRKKSSSKRGRREPTQMAPTSDRISEIQTALNRGGYYSGVPSGKWDADTVGAVQKFQSSNGLDVTGKLDALTLQKLGLGSDVAGVSAPKGITPHSCCSMTPSPSYAPPVSSAPKAAPSAQSAVPASSASMTPVETSQK